MTNMEGVGARIKTDIRADRGVGAEAIVKTAAHLMYEAAIGEVSEELGAIRSDHDPMLPSEG